MLGKSGENAAVSYLRNILHYKILQQNYRHLLGEIDIIAADGPVIVFVEVKTRQSLSYGRPAEAVEKHKQKKIASTAAAYLCQHNLWDRTCRFDVVEVIRNISGFRIRHIRHAFWYTE